MTAEGGEERGRWSRGVLRGAASHAFPNGDLFEGEARGREGGCRCILAGCLPLFAGDEINGRHCMPSQPLLSILTFVFSPVLLPAPSLSSLSSLSAPTHRPLRGRSEEWAGPGEAAHLLAPTPFIHACLQHPTPTQLTHSLINYLTH